MSFLSFIGDAISSIFGGSTQASRQQGREQNQANQYANQAAGGYQSLVGQGQQDLTNFNEIFPSLLGQYFQAAGMQNPYGSGGSLAAPPSGGQVTVGGTPVTSKTNAQGAGTLVNKNTGQPLTASQTQPAQAPNPYGLTPAMQTQMNTQMGSLNQSYQTSLKNLQESMAAQGIDDPRAMEAATAYLGQQHAAESQAIQSQFALQAQQQQVANVMNMLQLMAGQQSQGAQIEEAGSSGYGGLAGAAQNQANIAQAQDNSMNSGLMGLLGTALTGGFGNLFGDGGGSGVWNSSLPNPATGE